MEIEKVRLEGSVGNSQILEALKMRATASFITTDDETAKALLFELGKLENTLKQIAQAPDQTVVYRHDGNSTHWIFVVHFGGCTDKKENGFCASCLPKLLVNRAEMERQFKQLIDDHDGAAPWRN